MVDHLLLLLLLEGLPHLDLGGQLEEGLLLGVRRGPHHLHLSWGRQALRLGEPVTHGGQV